LLIVRLLYDPKTEPPDYPELLLNQLLFIVMLL